MLIAFANGSRSTRNYMRARIDYVVKMLKLDSHDAIALGLENLLDMMRLCRGDNLGVRDMIPSLYVRLNQDQKCYDFIKWYATEGSRSDYDWGDIDLPFLNLENEDVMEDVALFHGRFSDAAHGIPITLIKVRMLLDLRDVQASSALLGIDRLNFDAVQHIQERLELRSPVWSSKPALLSAEGMDERIKVLERQTDEMFAAIKKSNRLIWQAIVHPAQYAQMSPSSYSHGSVEETVILLMSNGKAWAETDGALDWISKKL